MAARDRAEQNPGDPEGDSLELEFRAQENTHGDRQCQHKYRMCYACTKK